MSRLSFRRIGAVYVWALIIVVFSALSPEVFMKTDTIRAVANGSTISSIAALAILVPLVTGIYDVSIGGNISLSSVLCASLLIHTDLSSIVVIVVTLAVGVMVGLSNALVVVALRIPSLIGTLAIGGIADALSVAFSGNQTLSSPRIAGSFSYDISQVNVAGFTVSVFYVVVMLAVIDLILTQTPMGRYSYAVGFNAEVSRLAGIRVLKIQIGALMVSGIIGAFAGIVFTATVASATPNSGDVYLLPAFAAVFLGATQFKAKRFNAAGTVLAVLMLGTGQYGLAIVGAPPWSFAIFQGIVLIAAIGLTQLRRSSRTTFRQARRAAENVPVVVDLSEVPAGGGSSGSGLVG